MALLDYDRVAIMQKAKAARPEAAAKAQAEAKQSAELQLKRLREESYNNDIVYGTYISADGTAALILAGSTPP